MKRSSVFKKLFAYIGKEKRGLILSIACAFLATVTSLAIPFLQGRAIDGMAAGEGSRMDIVVAQLRVMTVCIVTSSMATYVMNRINYGIIARIEARLRNDAFSAMQHMSLSTLDGYAKGDAVSRITTDADTVGDGLLLGFTQLFTGIMTILGTIIFMLRISWMVTIAVLVLTPLSFYVARFIAKSTFSLFKQQSEIRGRQTTLAAEMIENQKLVVAFGYEDTAKERFRAVNEELRGIGKNAVFFSSLVNPATRLVNAIVYAAVALLGSLLAIMGRMTVGGLTSFLGYASQYTKPFNEITGVVTEFQNALACAGRLFEFIETPPEEEPEQPVFLDDPKGDVEFKDVSFSYDKSKKLIEHLSLSAKKGEKVAIVGPTGSGKTTIIQLLMQFYDVDDGKITLDGDSLSDIDKKSLRTNIGMVLQDTWIREGTIKDNLLFAKPDATDEEIIAAAKASHAHSFIRRLPDGYDTFLASGGEGISQGQRQLLCITRVMLNLPPMLILDEATSSIDTRTEQKIQAAFMSMMKGRTSFIVAHRLSTVRSADIILVVKDGSVVEMGKHNELMEQQGFYYQLHKAQVR